MFRMSVLFYQVLVLRTVLLTGFLAGLFAGSTPAIATPEGSVAEAAESTAMAAMAERLQKATVRIVTQDDRCSGVIVTEDGVILTVAHGLPVSASPDAESLINVYLWNGRKHASQLLFRDDRQDIAVLKLTAADSDKWHSLPVRQGAVPDVGSCVLACGYPGRETHGQPPVLRVGQVLSADDHSVRTSCLLTVGDSGGPLLDKSGQLAGLHRRIGLAADSNHHLLVSTILPMVSRWISVTDTTSEKVVSLKHTLLSPSDDLLQALKQQTVRILTELPSGDRHDLIAGTVLDHPWIGTKLSELNDQSALLCSYCDGSLRGANLIYSDQAMDLAILRVSDQTLASTAANGPGAGSQPARLPEHTQGLKPRTIVFADSGGGGHSRFYGIVARSIHSEPSQVPRFGAALAVSDNGLVVQHASSGGGALLAGIREGDILIKAGITATRSLEDFDRVLRKREPGDWLECHIDRTATSMTFRVRLQTDPSRQFERTEFLDGRAGRLSQRRTGFIDVIQHDIPVAPEQCGGPLLDRSGNLLGINIARRSRESTLALPVEMVLKWMKLQKQINPDFDQLK